MAAAAALWQGSPGARAPGAAVQRAGENVGVAAGGGTVTTEAARSTLPLNRSVNAQLDKITSVTRAICSTYKGAGVSGSSCEFKFNLTCQRRICIIAGNNT